MKSLFKFAIGGSTGVIIGYIIGLIVNHFGDPYSIASAM